MVGVLGFVGGGCGEEVVCFVLVCELQLVESDEGKKNRLGTNQCLGKWGGRDR